MSERSDPGGDDLRREVPPYGFYSQGSYCRNVLNSQCGGNKRLESPPPLDSADLLVRVRRKWDHGTSQGNEVSALTT